jgi:hypothetical protein
VSGGATDTQPPKSWTGVLIPGVVLLVFVSLLILAAVFGFVLWLEHSMATMD